jgi:hypothetical protein
MVLGSTEHTQHTQVQAQRSKVSQPQERERCTSCKRRTAATKGNPPHQILLGANPTSTGKQQVESSQTIPVKPQAGTSKSSKHQGTTGYRVHSEHHNTQTTTPTTQSSATASHPTTQARVTPTADSCSVPKPNQQCPETLSKSSKPKHPRTEQLHPGSPNQS